MAASGSKAYQLAIKIAGKVDPSLGKAVESAQGTLSKLGSLAGTVAKAGAVALAVATAAALAFATSAVDAGMQFDTAMSQVAATMGTTTDQVGELRDYALEMGSKTAFSATEAADALNYMALAGYNAETSMAMLPNVLNLAAAGAIDLASASDMITDAQSALGLTLEQTSAMVDQMAAASSKSNTSVAQLGEAILTVGGTAQYMAGGTQELNTVLGVLADNGIKGSEGGTHLRNMLLKLASPTKDATALLNNLGVEVFDTQGNMRNFAEIFPQLNAAMSNLTDQERLDAMSTLFNSRDIASATALLSTTAERWEELGAAIENSAGAAERMANTQLDNLAGDITLFKSALEGAQIALSDQLTPSLRGFVQFGTNAISSLSDAFKEGGLSGAMEALGDIISDGLNMAIAELPGMTEAGMQLLGAIGAGLKDNLPMITDAATQIALMLLMGLVDAAPDIAESAVEIIATLANSLGDALPELTPAAVDMILRIVETLTDPQTMTMLLGAAVKIMGGLAMGLIASVPRLASAVQTIMGNLVTVISGAFPVDQILSKVQDGINVVGAFLQERIPVLGAYFTGWASSISAAIDNAMAILGGIIDFIRNVFTGNWSAAWQNVMDIFGNLFGGIVNLAKAPMNGVISLINSVLEKVNGISLTIPDWVPGVGGKTLGFNLPTIPQLAQGGIVDTPTLLEAGEAGTEAIIPLSELWTQMQDLVDESLKSTPTVSDILNELKDEKGGSGSDGKDGKAPIQFYYSPQNHYHFEGEAPNREELTAAEKMSQEEFNRMAKQWLKDLDRTEF